MTSMKITRTKLGHIYTRVCAHINRLILSIYRSLIFVAQVILVGKRFIYKAHLQQQALSAVHT